MICGVALSFKTLDDVETSGKRVLIRVDMNCSVDPTTKKLTDTSRIKAVQPTLRELVDSSVVLMAHQGSPGSDDFISLEQHTDALKDLGFNASFVADIFGVIGNLHGSEVIWRSFHRVGDSRRRIDFEYHALPIDTAAIAIYIQNVPQKSGAHEVRLVPANQQP